MRHILGFGNILHGDDGAGPWICQLLSQMQLAVDVRIFDVGTRGLDALAVLTECSEAVLLDATVPAGSPGLIRNLTAFELEPDIGNDMHHNGLATLLSTLPLLTDSPPSLRLITIEAANQRRFDQRLSPQVQQSCQQIACMLADEFGVRYR